MLGAERLDGRELAAPAVVLVPHRAHDHIAWLVGLAAVYLSVAAYVITDRLGAVLLYKDSISHLEIARRVLDSTSPGLAQLGAVWLPLPIPSTPPQSGTTPYIITASQALSPR